MPLSSLPRLTLATLVVAALYALTGWLGLLLAIPPGYATMFWPPAGLAVVAVAIGGARLAPAVWLGSFLTNLFLTRATPDGSQAVAAALVGVGAALQALAAARLARPILVEPFAFDRAGPIVRLALLCGPLSSVVAATWGVGSLWARGRVATADLAENWMTWWLGDALSGALLAPPLLRAYFSPRPWRLWLSSGLPVAVAVTLTVLMFLFAQHQERRRVEADLQQRASEITAQFEQRFERARESLSALRGLIQVASNLDRDSYRRFTRELLIGQNGLAGVGWFPRVRAVDVNAFAAKHSAPGRPFAVKTDRADAVEVYPMLYAEPATHFTDFFGDDLGDRPMPWLPVVEQARDLGQHALSAPTPFPSPSGPRVVLIALPVYEGEPRITAVAERRARLRGLVGGLVNLEESLALVTGSLRANALALAVTLPDTAAPVFAWSPGDSPPHAPHAETTFAFGGQTWQLAFRATNGHPALETPWAVWLVLTGGLLFSAVLGTLLMIVTGHASSVERVVAERTEDLRAANVRIAQAAEERQSVERKMLEAQRLESLGVLAGGIAHDFNNLLTAVLGHAELAAADVPDNSEAREHLKQVSDASRRAAELCRQMLAYAGQGKFVVGPVDLNQLVEELTDLLRVSVPRGANLAVEPAAQLPPVEGDATQLRQVILNLITNAAEALDHEGGAIHVQTAEQQVAAGAIRRPGAEALPAGPYVVLRVRDDGRGMDEATRDRIFEPFFTTKFTGRGLGLAAVQGITHAHGGALTVSSTPGAGSTFALYLPALPRQTAAATPLGTPRPWRGTGVAFVIDDEAAVRQVTATLTKQLGFTVVPFASGKAALDEYSGQTPSVALIDLTMPELDGRATAYGLGQRYPGLPIVLMSGFTLDGPLDHSVGGALQKPFSLAELAAALQAVCDA